MYSRRYYSLLPLQQTVHKQLSVSSVAFVLLPLQKVQMGESYVI